MLHLRLLIAAVFLLFAPVLLNAQTLRGRVYITGTETGIANASVYYNASTTGTATNSSGDFTLLENADHIPLIVSCVGYVTATIDNYDAKIGLKIYLKPKTQLLHEVVIGLDGMSRKDKEKIFLKQFLGTSSFAKGCIITNLSAIELIYHRKTKTLTAACDTPLQIDNKPLGYHINYFLQTFTYSPDATYFAGNFFYKDNFLPNEQRNVFKNRETVYQGSRLQFIRALWAGKLKQKGFKVYNAKGIISYNPFFKNTIVSRTPLPEDSIIRVDSGRKLIDVKDKHLLILYEDGPTVVMQSNPVLITNAGYYATGLEWDGGSMADQRIGDYLPYEYWPDEDMDEKSVTRNNIIAPVKTDSTAVAVQTPVKEPQKPSLLLEKVYLHTDRDTYIQGDTLWFKAYLVNGQDNRLMNSSNNLYVELIAPDSAKVIDSKLIRLEEGLGNGDMAIADSLPAGKYTLRAYTNWMRNFGDNFVFEKNINIINISPAAAASPAVSKGKKPNRILTPVVSAPHGLPTIRFYPEGGAMVEGVNAIVGVKAEDANGKGIAARGSIISSAGDTLAHFSCDSLGLGMFVMLPLAGQHYHAVTELGSHHDTFELPAALTKGLTLQIRQTDSIIHALVNAGGLNTHTVNLLVKHTGKTVLSRQLKIQGTQLAFKISKDDLPEGVSAITLYNEQGKPECERLVYIHHPNEDNIISITGKKSYSPNEQVSINIHSRPHAHLSMAVVDAETAPVQAVSILSYLSLQSELRGNIEAPNRYFDTTNVNRFKQLDLLLLTQGWRDFVWRRLADTAIRISYATENSITISGKIRDENRNKLLPNLNISLYANLSTKDKLFTTVSDSLGHFAFNGLLFKGKGTIQLAAVDSKGKARGTFSVDTLLPMPVQKRITKQTELETLPKSGITDALTKKANTVGSPFNKVTALAEVNIVDNRYKKYTLPNGLVYSGWGTSLNQSLDITAKDYEFKNLRWYAIAHLNGARADINGTGIRIPEGKSLIKPIVVVTKGAVWDRHNKVDFYSLPIDRFKHISLKRVYVFSKDGSPGMVTYLILLELRDNYNVDNPGELNTEAEGYYQARTFYKPINEKEAAQYAYRSTIHWEPDITTNASGNATVSFYNTNRNTNTHIIVEGISIGGNPLTGQASYQTLMAP